MPYSGRFETCTDSQNSTSEIEDNIYNELISIVNGGDFAFDNCTRCIAATELMHIAALSQSVSTVTNLLIRACENVPILYGSIYAATCYEEYSGIGGLGPYYAQLFGKMSLTTTDIQGWCFFQWSVCTRPPTIAIDENAYFKPKPANRSTAPVASGMFFLIMLRNTY